MASKLVVDKDLGEKAQPVKDENGNASPLSLSTDKVGIGTTEPTQALDMGGQKKNIKFGYTHIGETGGGAATIIANKARVNETENNRVDYSLGGKDGVSAIELLYTNGISFFTKPIDDVNHTVEGDQFFSFKDRTHERMRISSEGNVGIGVKNIGKKLEVVGDIVVRVTPEVGGTAVALEAENSGLASLWTNNGYDPAKPISGWKRTINMKNGNVGIGRRAKNPTEALEVHGNILATGDVRLSGADCAEDFNVEKGQTLEPGSVMVIGDEDQLHQCEESYDKRVAGVLSGAGNYKPGIVLDKQQSQENRMPLALMGKVFCKVDAQYGQIGVGDLLTTSPTKGHAMKAGDPLKAFGTVIGKALRAMTEGQGLIPVLVSLQ